MSKLARMIPIAPDKLNQEVSVHFGRRTSRPGLPSRRAALASVVFAPFLALRPALAAQSGYPSRPIRVVIPFASGGTIDMVCRGVMEQLSKELGQAVFLDAKPGANGVLGTSVVASSPADGHTLLLVTASFAVNPSIYVKLPYNPRVDLKPITPLVRGTGLILIANPSLNARSLSELVDISSRSDLNYSSSGIGNVLHLSMEVLKKNTGLRATHVPYKGSPAALNAVVANEVQLAFVTPVIANSFIRAGRVVPIATSASSRMEDYPRIPTLTESGSRGLGIDGSWIGMFCPAGTPEPIVDQLHTTIKRILDSPAISGSITSNGSGFLPDGRSPAEFKKQLAADFDGFARAVKLAGIQPE